MSEKLLANACDGCPMRKIIDCNTAVLKNVISDTDIVYSQAYPQSEGYGFEMTDALNDPNARLLELQPFATDQFEAAAVTAETAKQLEMSEVLSRMKQDSPERILQQLVADKAIGDAGTESLEKSLAETITACTGPESSQSALFMKQKKCGADILGRVTSRRMMRKRNRDDAIILGAPGTMLWTTPDEVLPFKSIK